MSWLKKIGQVIAKIFGVVQKAEPTVAGVAEALLPEYAPFIESAGTIFQNVIKEIVTVESAFAGQAGRGRKN